MSAVVTMHLNLPAQWISLFSTAMHLAIGLPELFRIGPRFLPASWALIYGWLPDEAWWIWPGFYVVTGLAAMLGVWDSRLLRRGFQMSAMIHFIWGSVSVYGWLIQAGGTLPGSFTYWFLAGVLAVLSHYVKVGERVTAEVSELATVVEETQIARANLFNGT